MMMYRNYSKTIGAGIPWCFYALRSRPLWRHIHQGSRFQREFPEFWIHIAKYSCICPFTVLAPLGRFEDQVVSIPHSSALFVHPDTAGSITLRPTEFQDLWGAVLGGQVDHEEILTNKDALIRFIEETTGRKDLVVGEVKELNDFRL